ncbi:hypothetical protein EDC01DRAFT_779157 [Geopyxis carbonaria]|nr:hypothetical protein EDC01DRAFT_779157 [Geopyxis carbonaria]
MAYGSEHAQANIQQGFLESTYLCVHASDTPDSIPASERPRARASTSPPRPPSPHPAVPPRAPSPVSRLPHPPPPAHDLLLVKQPALSPYCALPSIHLCVAKDRVPVRGPVFLRRTATETTSEVVRAHDSARALSGQSKADVAPTSAKAATSAKGALFAAALAMLVVLSMRRRRRYKPLFADGADGASLWQCWEGGL